MLRMKSRFCVLILVACTIAGGPSAVLAQSGGGQLPIAEGAWVDIDIPCGQAESVYAYFAGRFGELMAYGDEVEGSLEPVTSPRRAADGFTTASGDDEEYVHVKAAANDRAVVRAGGMGATGVDHSADINVRRCETASLPAPLRAAIGRHIR